MFYFINIALGLILLAFVAVIIVKKVFVELKGSDRGIVNLAVIVLCLTGVICAVSTLLGVFSIHEATIVLNTEKNISSEGVDLIKTAILDAKANNIIYMIVGYISLVFDYIMYKAIKKKKQQELIKDKRHWNLDKLS